jgi:two-component system response regulator HydG
MHEKGASLDRDFLSRFDLDGILGRSQRMRHVHRLVREVLNTDSTVLLQGESGTGKGLLARIIHVNSRRVAGYFVEVNCAVYPEGLLQAELFGHERGAFTGALRRKRGRLELAHGGSVFLDEIGEVSLQTQVLLLRFLQERTFERVGGEERIETHVRVLAATNGDLAEEVRRGHFREDLYYRLNVIPIHLPPLRERLEDLPILAGGILSRCAGRLGRAVEGFRSEAMEALLRHPWPGNIRELESVIERAALLAHESFIEPCHLPPEIAGRLRDPAPWLDGASPQATAAEVGRNPRRPVQATTSANPGPPSSLSLEEAERRHILRVLEACGGNKKRAAELLGIHRSSLYAKLKRFGIDHQRYAGVR